MHRPKTARRAALALLALLLVAVPSSARADERPEWVFWLGHMHVRVTQDTGWSFHDQGFDECTDGQMQYDGEGEEYLVASTVPGQELVGIFMHARTGEMFLRSEDRDRPTGEKNTMLVKAHARTRRMGKMETTQIGGHEPDCGGDPENGDRPPRADCGTKNHRMDLRLRFNGALENLTVRHDTPAADPLFKNCPNATPIKSPNLIPEFSRKVVGEGPIDKDTWGYRISGHGKSKANGKVSWITYLDWTALIYRYGEAIWVAGKGDGTPVPWPDRRAHVRPPTAAQIAAAPLLDHRQAAAKLRVGQHRPGIQP